MLEQSDNQAPAGAQALFRGLAVIEAVAQGARSLADISAAIGCTRSTTHRLIAALVQAGYLRALGGNSGGYQLGPRLIELGYKARAQMPLAKLAHPHLERLSHATQDTVHLGVREAGDVLYIEKLPGSRGLEMRSRIGLRMPLAMTGIGKSLMLDLQEAEWLALYQQGRQQRAAQRETADVPSWEVFRDRMRDYASGGFSLDLEDNELGIRCVAAPIRDAGGQIVAALSVASAVPYMPEARLYELRPEVIACAAVISAELGWRP
ncbi:IclR family transcriptional regulator [Phytopseudomonas punonensis]|uniref:HTH-type transcriptional repressor AllR n=1 Tax=Phytopseudomonas punonensis TaxID=1220495 RepID=A0A1M6ZCY5_9GAMM|nr:IclR family transcriptional regulator [Pseudomonas punonensis]SHL28376.1 transcriptional regulator, IclR family [Pseudomonas punonensis]